MSAIKQRITPFLWFNDNAEEAVDYYVGIFKNSKVGKVTRYTKESAQASGRPERSVMTIAFALDGQEFTAINGGPEFKFTEAISLVVHCKDQKEIDHYWNKLSQGGPAEAQMCGWLKDRFGLSWQIVPTVLGEMMADPDRAKAKRASDAMMKMVKIDIAALRAAFAGTTKASR